MRVAPHLVVVEDKVPQEISTTIKRMFIQSYQIATINKSGLSAHSYFVKMLEVFCENKGFDFRTWNLSMYRLFSLKSQFPGEAVEHIVRHVLNRDKEVLKITG
jgi:hypothetical protein